MSMPMPMSTKSDLRSTTRDAQRAATAKAKWAHGATNPVGRQGTHPRPLRMSDMTHGRSPKTRVSGSSNKAAHSTRADIEGVAADWPSLAVTLGSSPGAWSDATSEDEAAEAVRLVDEYESLGDVYGAGDEAPGSGSQVLHGALKRAIEQFEDRETVKLVRNEWALVDGEGEVVASPRKGKKEEWIDGEEFEMV
ncbi:hypothetical protein CAC42_4295 [Sphaceloma murrayae]|uniref:Uncharacterized protein n=1 Tax=Sphaceloma murrayae TaxID=2082308 RepID=A0A2K1QLZ8_9PEZI|nr:hypothetical protein CAC42_4295 [Sphaceloma murrayae]